jgi:uncharacterized protein with predicted RNA binding PUA domain
VSTNCLESSTLRRVQVIADYQWGRGIGTQLFPEECEFTFSTTGRVRQVLLGKDRLATVRAEDGRLTLGIRGAERLHHALPPPSYRVVILEDVAEFIAAGKNAFSKHVVSADQSIRAGDEVLVVCNGDSLLATGTAMLSGAEMLAFNYGLAVKVRQGGILPCCPEE